MSVAGAIPVFICLILFLVQRENYDYIWSRRLLLAGLFFFLIPVQLVKGLLPERILPHAILGEESQMFLSKSLVFLNERQGEVVWLPGWASVIISLWAAVIFIFAVSQFIKYRRGIRIILSFIDHVVDRSDIDLTYSVVPDGFCGPCTVGFFRQRIIIPESFVENPDFLMVYQHEYRHLRNHDNLMKLLCLAVLCLHWMNPMAYVLLYLYRFTAEAVSDGAAIECCSDDEIERYSIMVVTGVPEEKVFPTVWKNNLSSKGKMLKRRISYMMERKNTGLLQKVLMVALAIVTVIASACTVFAYEPMQSSDESIGDVVSDYESGDFFSYDIEDADFINSTFIDNLDFSNSEEVFCDSNGIQSEIYASDNARALCIHSMVNGYFSKHSSNGSGGCTVTVYTCQRCNKCGYLANAKYYKTITYAKCPH